MGEYIGQKDKNRRDRGYDIRYGYLPTQLAPTQQQQRAQRNLNLHKQSLDAIDLRAPPSCFELNGTFTKVQYNMSEVLLAEQDPGTYATTLVLQFA